ncbi:MAG: hypothetical protein U0074_08595 [Kouleothrix sp.]
MIQALIAGLAYPFRALGLLARTRRLWGYVLIDPGELMLVSATLYAALLFTGLRAIGGAVATLPAWAALFGSCFVCC